MTTAREESVHLADLLRREHRALSDFLVALSAFDRERRWLELGYTSLFYYLHRELGLPKGPAYYRKTAAELIQKYPELVEPLRDGRLNLSTIVEVANVITPENREEVLPRFFGTSRREAKEVVAELRPDPAPPLRTVVTEVRPSASLLAPSDVLVPPVLQKNHYPQSACPAVALPSAAREFGRPRPTQVEPLTADLTRLHLTVSRRLLDKLFLARDALSHSHPGASDDVILEVGLDLVIERHRKRRGIGVGARPGTRSGSRTPAPPSCVRPRRTAPRLLPRAGAAATSPPRSGARSGSATGAAASGRSRAAGSAGTPAGSSLITSTAGHWGRTRPSTRAGCSAPRTTTCTRALSTGTAP